MYYVCDREFTVLTHVNNIVSCIGCNHYEYGWTRFRVFVPSDSTLSTEILEQGSNCTGRLNDQQLLSRSKKTPYDVLYWLLW